MKKSLFLILLLINCIMLFSCGTSTAKNEVTIKITKTTQQLVGIFEIRIAKNNTNLEDFINGTDDVCIFYKGLNCKVIYVATKNIQKNYFNPTYKINNDKTLVIHFDYKENKDNEIHLYKIVLDNESKYDCFSVKIGDGKFKDFNLIYNVDIDPVS